MKYTLYSIILILTVAFIASCKPDQKDINSSSVTLEPIVFKRLDKDVFALTPENIKEQTTQMQKTYHSFYMRYVSSIINNGGVTDSLYSQSMLRFINDKDIKAAYADVKKMYSDNDIELMSNQMTEAVKRFKAVFPKRKTPKQFVTFMSGFNYNTVYTDSTLGIGLDMYLGDKSPFYQMMQLPKFRTRTMTKDFVVSDAVRSWLITEFDNAEPVNNLLYHMVFYGKLFYVADALLSEVQDSIKIGYTTKQIKICQENEKNYWGFFVKDNMLFENDLKIVTEFTADGPFTRAISSECPPRIAMWIGWQIVSSYMEHNTDITLEQLMEEKDFQKILSKSKYKP